MSAALSIRHRERLIACLTLWQRPGTPAECDAAAAGAIGVLSNCGFSWSDVIAPPPHRELLHGTWRTTCAELVKRPGELRPWERRFVADLPRFVRISMRQRHVLNEIAARVFGGER